MKHRKTSIKKGKSNYNGKLVLGMLKLLFDADFENFHVFKSRTAQKKNKNEMFYLIHTICICAFMHMMILEFI